MKLFVRLLGSALAVLGTCFPAYSETAADGIEVRPLYLSEDGAGILRFDDPAGSTDEFSVAFGGETDNATRSFEVFGALGGPWKGPKVSVCITDFSESNLMGGKLLIELFNDTTGKPVVRYRPEFDPSEAEEIRVVGENAEPGECSKKYAP